MISQHADSNHTSNQPAFSFTKVHQSFASTEALSGFDFRAVRAVLLGLSDATARGKLQPSGVWWDLRGPYLAKFAS